MTLQAIGTAIGTVAKAAVAAIGSLSLGEAIAVGTVIGVAAYTGYALIKAAKKKIQHAINRKSKERTATENILEDALFDENGEVIEEEDLIGKEKKAHKSASLFEKIRSFFKTEKKSKKKFKYTDAEWAEYYRDQIHRSKDTPEEYERWKKNHRPITEDRKYREEMTRRHKNRSADMEHGPTLHVSLKQIREEEKKKRKKKKQKYVKYPFMVAKDIPDLDELERRVIYREQADQRKWEREQAQDFWSQPWNTLDY